MTVRLPAWLQAGSYGAELDRSVGTALLSQANEIAGRGGVRRYTGNEFAVSATSPAGMTLNISPGTAWVQGAYATTQGAYTVVNDSTFSVTVTTSSSNPRIDLVILEVLDSVYQGSSNLAQVRVIAGNPATTPTVPTATGSYIALAQILVPANATSIITANITDLRPFGGLLNTPIPVRNVTERNALPLFDGQRVYRMDAGWEVNTYVGGVWYGSAQRLYTVPAGSIHTFSNVTGGNPATIVDRMKVVDPGYQYLLRLDHDGEVLGGRVDAYGYVEATTTQSFSSLAWHSQSLDAAQYSGYNRVRVNWTWNSLLTGNRWVSLQYKNGFQTSVAWSNTNFYLQFQVTVIPTVPGALINSPSLGGQP